MPLPNSPWSTNFPASQDTGTNAVDQQPTLSNDSTPGANDGHRVLVEHLHALRNKLHDTALFVGDTSDLPGTSLRKRVTDLEAAGSTNVAADGTDAVPGTLTLKLDTPAVGVTKSVVDLGGGDRQVQLALNFSSGSGAGYPVEDNDARMTDSRAPSGSASGQLGGTYPAPTVRGIRETGAGTELTIGTITDGEFLKRSGTALISGVAGGASPLTTKGDVFTYDTGDQRLAIGTDGQVLTADNAEATGIKWAASTPLTTKGDVLSYDTADQRLAVGTNGQVLTADSVEATGIKWAAASPLTTKGDLFTYDTADQRLAVGTNGHVLTADSTEATGVKWAAAAGGFAAREEEFTAVGGTETFTLAATAAVNANMLSGRNILGVYRNGLRNRYRATATTALEWDLPAGNQVRIPSLSASDLITVVYGD